jgi:uncharacterized protein involved in propanediol utilization
MSVAAIGSYDKGRRKAARLLVAAKHLERGPCKSSAPKQSVSPHGSEAFDSVPAFDQREQFVLEQCPELPRSLFVTHRAPEVKEVIDPLLRRREQASERRADVKPVRLRIALGVDFP